SAVLAGDGRKWSAISVTGLAGSLSLGGVITASVSNLVVKVNSASGLNGVTAATPLNWTTNVPTAAIALTDTELFFVDGDLTGVSLADVVGGGAHFQISRSTVNVTTPALTGARLNTFTLPDTELFFVDGDLTGVSLADVIGGGAHFQISRSTVNVATPALTGARLNTFTLSSLQLSSSFGLSITGGTISVVSLLPSASA